MTTKPDPRPWPDLSQFQKNRATVPLEVQLPYVNQYVAWSLDGTRILAGAATRDELHEKLRAAGIDTGQVVFDYISDPNLSWL